MSAPESDSLFGRLVVEQGLATAEQVQECLSTIERLTEQGITPVPKLGELLMRRGYLSPTQMEATMRASQTPKSRGSSGGTAAASPAEVAEAERDPQNVVGRYVRVKRLGAGGMGEVWKGWDRELRRWVALKFLKGDDPAELARFEREAQTAAALNHPNIAAVYEVGREAGRAYIAMQLVNGQTLASFPRADRRLLVRLIRDCALALHHAHGLGVIHRDLKPHNLMVEGKPGDSGLRVYVMDFGLAKQTSVESSLSVSGHILGTPAYMPPEQARGRVHEADARSDVYSLGATLYELLTERAPFQDTDVFGLLKQVVEKDPAPPRKVNPRIEPDLETIVLKCLEKEPARRYASVAELAAELDRFLEGQAILAHPPSVLYKARKFLVRHRAIAVPSAAAIVVAMAAAAWVGKGSAEKKAQEAAIKSIETVRPVLDRAYRYLYDRNASYEELTARTNRAKAALEETLRTAPDLSLAHYHVGRCWDVLGFDDQAEVSFRRAIELDPAFGPPRFQLGRLLLIRSYLVSRKGHTLEGQERQRSEATKIAEEAARELEAAQGRSGFEEEIQRDVATAMLTFVRGDLPGTLRLAREGIAKYKNADGVEELHWLVALGARGNDEVRAPAVEEALRIRPNYPLVLYLRYLDRWQAKVAGSREDIDRAIAFGPRISMLRFGRSILRAEAKDFDGAIADLDEGLNLDPKWPEALHSRGGYKRKKGDVDGARADYEAASRIDPAYSRGWIALGMLEREQKHPDLAEKAFARAEQIEPGAREIAFNRSFLRSDAGDVKAALAEVERSLRIDPAYAAALFERGRLRQLLKDYDASAADYRVALKAGYAAAESLGGLSSVLLEKGDLAGAQEACEAGLRADAESGFLLGQRATLRFRTQDYDGAIADARKSLQIDPKAEFVVQTLDQSLVNRGAARLRSRDLDGALADAEEAVKLLPSNPGAWSCRGRVRTERGDIDGGIADLSESIRIKSDFADTWCSRGMSRNQKGAFKEALADFDQAIRLGPPLADYYGSRAVARLSLGDAAGALKDLDEALRLDPRQVDAWANRSMIRVSSGDFKGAEADATEALRLKPDHVHALMNRCSARVDLKKFAEAIADASEVIRLTPQSPTGWALRGEAKAVADDRKGAAEDFRKCLELAPKNWPQRPAVEQLLKQLAP